jgi:hypothetical protein
MIHLVNPPLRTPGMKLLLALICLCLAIASAAIAQTWDSVIRLTHDDYMCGFQRMAVDDSLHLHVFYVRSVSPQVWQPNTLVYQRFDNWGNALCDPMELLPGNHDVDYEPGVLLDRNNVLWVVWGRTWWTTENRMALYLARMNLDGEFLTEPTELNDHCPLAGINLVQKSNGDVWVGYEIGFQVFSEDGDVLRPYEDAVPLPNWADNVRLGVDPLDHIWALTRYYPSHAGQAIGLVRLDTTVREARIVWPPQTPCWEQMTQQAFFVDTTGGFHCAIYSESGGFFYGHDSLNGTGLDTVILEPNGRSGRNTNFAWSGDTLSLLWDHPTMTYDSTERQGFRLDGSPLFGPVTYAAVLPMTGQLLTKSGGYWVPGGLNIAGVYTLAMLHVPGPDEPANDVADRHYSVVSNEFTVYPNPTNGGISLSGPLASVKSLAIYNVLGQRVMTLANGARLSNWGSVPIQFEGLPSGTYFLEIGTRDAVERTTIKLVR